MSKKAEVLGKAEAILLKSEKLSIQDEQHVKSLLRLADLLEEPETRGSNVQAEELRARVAERANHDAETEEFRHYVRSNAETRTYTALNIGTGSSGGYLVPKAWQAKYQQRLVSSSGILKAGATVVDTDNAYGHPWLHFFSDDTSNQAVVLAENAQFSGTPDPVASVMTPTVQKFSTAGLTSAELAADSAFDLDGYLQNLFGVRVARKFNNVASVDATYGVIGQFTVGATAASATVPTIAELTTMQTAIDYAYREDGTAKYMLSATMEAVLRQQVGSSGNKVYPEMEKGQLLGHDYVVNVDMPYAAGSVGVAFGSFARAILVQNVRPILVRSVEKFAEYNQIFYAFHHRMGVKVVDTNAVTALQLHS